MKNTPDGINSRITDAEEWMSDLEDRMVEITETEQNMEKRKKKGEMEWQLVRGRKKQASCVSVPDER